MRATKTMQSYRLDQLTIDSIDALAERHDMSKAEVVAAAVELLMRWDESNPVTYLEQQRDAAPTYEPLTEREEGQNAGMRIGLDRAISVLRHVEPRL